MKQKNLYIMSAPPGSGKSYWLSKHATGEHDMVISRDAIRFSLVQEDEDYFSKENMVFDRYVRAIQHALDDEDVENVYCDATQVSSGSRTKLIKRLRLTNVKKIAILKMDVTLETALARNAQRKGRAKVPEYAIKKMFSDWNTGYSPYEVIMIAGDD